MPLRSPPQGVGVPNQIMSKAGYQIWTDGTNLYRANLMTGNLFEAQAASPPEIHDIIEPILPAYVTVRGQYNSGTVLSGLTWTITNGNLGGSTNALPKGTILETDSNLTIQPPFPASGQSLQIQPNVIIQDVQFKDKNSHDISGTAGNAAFVHSVVNGSFNKQEASLTVNNGDIAQWITGDSLQGNFAPRAYILSRVDISGNGDTAYIQNNGGGDALRVVENSNSTTDIMVRVHNGSDAKGIELLTGTSGLRGVIKSYDNTAAAYKFADIDNAAWVIAASDPN